ncbi:MAG: phage minor head protein [Dehalococcoidia bacterium]|jgi:SPP1 gp7 family putative phage head morphogenesis protein
MSLPDREISAILKKFGPEIETYLRTVGFFDITGQYGPTDILNARAMATYRKASLAKNREVWAALEKWLFPEMVDFGAAFIATYGLIKPPNVKEIATDYIKERGGFLIKRMAATDQKRLTAFIWQNSMKNERPLARRILKEPNLVSIVAGHRPETIIRTERGRAIRSGSQNIAIGAGAKEKMWVTAGDGRVRPSHKSLNGTTWSIEEDIPGEGQYPGEIAIGCRCHLQYGFEAKRANYANQPMSTLEELYS